TASIAALELHPFLHRVPRLDRPTHVVFDLDPGEGAGLGECIDVLFLLRDVLTKLHLKSFPKVSGSKGIQVYLPLNTPTSYGARGRTPRHARARALPGKRALTEYEAKRHFDRTAEPLPALPRRSRQGSRRRFVIQKHAASHLHYDFRLEMNDVLKSWAVPKNLSLKEGETRTGFETEDHPIDYLEFEGIIPEGEYGGGTVMVWDIGTYEVLDGNYWKGGLRIFLSGKKLKGEWTLTRMEADAGKPKWLVVKTSGNV